MGDCGRGCGGYDIISEYVIIQLYYQPWRSKENFQMPTETFTSLLPTLAKAIINAIPSKHKMSLRLAIGVRTKRSSTAENTIIDILTRVLGNYADSNSIALRSLADLSNSQLLGQLFSIYSSNIDYSNANEVIRYIFNAKGERNKKSIDTFIDAFSYCMKQISLEAFSQREKLIRGMGSSEIDKKYDSDARKADANLAKILSHLRDKDGAWLETSEVNPFEIARIISSRNDPLRDYVSYLSHMMNSVDVHGPSGEVVRVDLDKIYVDVPVYQIARERNFNPYQDIRKDIPRRKIAENWQHVSSLIDKAVLLGDPGGGKSTLSKKLCLECCNQYQEHQQNLPIFVALRIFISTAADDKSLKLKDHIVESILSECKNESHNEVISILLYKLRIGNAFIILDGLDEVLTPANRQRVINEINFFKKEFPLIQILVTSRYVGYETQPIDDFDHFGIDDLTRQAAEKVYRNISLHVLKKKQKDVDQQASLFMRDAAYKAKELIKSPLLVTLIVIIYDKRREIPDDRANLYETCAGLLFDQWDRHRKIQPNLPERYRLFELFKHVSSILYEQEEYGGTMTRQQLFRETMDFFKSDYRDNIEQRASEAASHMVEHLTGRAWILHEVGENVFEFTHRTFLEYFYAKYLESSYEDTLTLTESSLTHVINGGRSLPTHLALQIRTEDNRRAAAKVTAKLTSLLNENFGQLNLVVFCLESLGYLAPTADTFVPFIQELCRNVIRTRNPDLAIKLICSNNPQRNTIIDICTEEFDSLKKLEDMQILIPSLYILHRNIRASEVESHDLNNKKDEFIQIIVDKFIRRQSQSPFIWKTCFDLDAAVDYKYAEKFGLRIWDNSHTTPPDIIRMYRDVRSMMDESSLRIGNMDVEEGKYFKLAFAIRKEVKNIWIISHMSSNSFFRYQIEKYRDFDVRVNTDFSSWVSDSELISTHAFCLITYAEICWPIMNDRTKQNLLSSFDYILNDCDEIDNSLKIHLREWLLDKE